MRRIGYRICGAIAIAIAVVIALYGLYLIVFGLPMILVIPDGPTYTERTNDFRGVIPLAGALLLIAGVVTGNTRRALLGAIGHLAFSVLFLFSIGGILIPATAVLLLLVVIRNVLAPTPDTAPAV